MEYCGCYPLVPESPDTLPCCVDTGSTAVALLGALKHSDPGRGQEFKGFHDGFFSDAVPAGPKLASDRGEIEPATLLKRILCFYIQDVDKRVFELATDLLGLPVPMHGIFTLGCMKGWIDEGSQLGQGERRLFLAADYLGQ